VCCCCCLWRSVSYASDTSAACNISV
jgi:hypothetical protein